MRRTIDEMPAMNREDSLKVLDKKLEKFLEQKQELRKELEANFDRQTLAIRSSSDNYNIASYELDNTFWTKKNIKNNMDNAARELKNNADIMYQNSQNYIKLMGSIDAVRQTKENGQKEIKQIEELRKSGKLIDISRRDIPNPNEALKQALADIRAAAGKFLCLPHKLMSMDEILKIVNPRNLSSGYNNEIMHHIEKLIKRTV